MCHGATSFSGRASRRDRRKTKKPPRAATVCPRAVAGHPPLRAGVALIRDVLSCDDTRASSGSSRARENFSASACSTRCDRARPYDRCDATDVGLRSRRRLVQCAASDGDRLRLRLRERCAQSPSGDRAAQTPRRAARRSPRAAARCRRDDARRRRADRRAARATESRRESFGDAAPSEIAAARPARAAADRAEPFDCAAAVDRREARAARRAGRQRSARLHAVPAVRDAHEHRLRRRRSPMRRSSSSAKAPARTKTCRAGRSSAARASC